MNNSIQNSTIIRRKRRVKILLSLLFIAIFLFLLSIFKTITKERRIPSHNTTMHDRSFRGAIISADHYTLSSSEKNYKAVIRGASIRPEKRELFIKLFSIYSGIDKKSIQDTLFNPQGKPKQDNIVLSKTLKTHTAMQLKTLALKLRKLGVFRSIKTRSGINVLYGLDIVEAGEYRRFPLHDVLTPALGYVRKDDNGKYIRPRGIKGLEKNYEEHITSKIDGYFRGKRDVLGTVIHDKNSINKERVDGLDLHLNVSLAVQRRIEYMLDEMKATIDAEQIMIGVMESNTGKVLSLASTERYDPAHIRQQDVPALDPKFSEYPHEAGSVIKPLTLAIALDKHKVTPKTWFNTYNGKLKIGKKRTITDDHKYASLDATDIIVHSSNVGISQVSWKLTGKEFREGLLNFGIANPSGLDLSRDLPGKLKPIRLLDNKMHRANSSYGYGMTATFAQLFKAYSAFNNDGITVTPRLVDYLGDGKGKRYTLKPKVGNARAISKRAAKQIQKILIEVVKRGTGVKAKYPGLVTGGKTGTAHIAKNGRYVREYHSSFYGFANDKKGNKYTIGVLVIKAKKPYAYFASVSAVPTFRKIVDILVGQGHLTPDPKAIKAHQEAIDKKATRKKPKSTLPKLWQKKKTKKKKKSIKKSIEKSAKKVKKKSTAKPAIQKTANELFEDLF